MLIGKLGYTNYGKHDFFYIKFNLFSFHIQNESICDFIFKKYVNFHFSKVKVTPDNTISDT